MKPFRALSQVWLLLAVAAPAWPGTACIYVTNSAGDMSSIPRAPQSDCLSNRPW